MIVVSGDAPIRGETLSTIDGGRALGDDVVCAHLGRIVACEGLQLFEDFLLASRKNTDPRAGLRRD